MKKFTIITRIFLVATLLFSFVFISCEKEDPAPPPVIITKGNVTFWNDDPAVDDITVTVSERSKIIDRNISPSSCSTDGCANFFIERGTYNFTANSANGYSWSGTCTISAGGCLKFHLSS